MTSNQGTGETHRKIVNGREKERQKQKDKEEQ